MTCTVKSRPHRNSNPFFMPHFGNILNEVMNTSLENITDNATGKGSLPAVNIKHSDENYSLWLAVPGYTKDGVTITIDKNQLIVSGKMENDTIANFRLKEFDYSNFKRSFTLPKDVNRDNIDADMKDGVLNITLHKRPEAQPKNIVIK